MMDLPLCGSRRTMSAPDISVYAMIFACGAFLTAAFVLGWSAGGLLFSSKPFERMLDYLVVIASSLLTLALYQIITL